MRICGVDPGLEATGYGVIEVDGPRATLVRAGVLRSSTDDPLAKRLKAIYTAVHTLLEATRPDCLVLEALYSHYDHPTTAILMGHVRGVILLAAGERGLPVESYSVTHVKKAVTGRGHATKTQIQRMVQMLLDLPAPPIPDDATDALGAALAHAHTLGMRDVECGMRIEKRRVHSAFRTPHFAFRS